MKSRLSIIGLLLAAALCFQQASAQMVPGISNPMLLSSGTVSSGNSLIFTRSSSQFLTATGKTSINAQKFTIATWFKLSSASASWVLWNAGQTTNNFLYIQQTSANHFAIQGYVGNSLVLNLITTATYADTTSWHHFLLGVDTTQSTSANEAKLWIDGTQVSSFSSATYPTQNTNLGINYAVTYTICTQNVSEVNDFCNNKLAQFYYIDGQQLTPTSFISGTPGTPVTYGGTYAGTFDFFLPFSNGASTTTLGYDSSGSGEGNNWTLNNMTTANQSTDYP